ncbi:hypothetical protein JW968_00115 [Candidatus Woesearchaeota archaeon]|nr:hypothetical protein [Candidatus Woesearchaeota archaeon]
MRKKSLIWLVLIISFSALTYSQLDDPARDISKKVISGEIALAEDFLSSGDFTKRDMFILRTALNNPEKYSYLFSSFNTQRLADKIDYDYLADKLPEKELLLLKSYVDPSFASTMSLSNLKVLKGKTWVDQSNLKYNDVISQARVDCFDSYNKISDVKFRLENLDDREVYFEESYTSRDKNTFYLDNKDVKLLDSGNWLLTATCYNSKAQGIFLEKSFFLTWGTYSPYLIDPTGPTYDVYHNMFFNFTTGVECVGGECGDTTATLDPPEQEEYCVFDVGFNDCTIDFTDICSYGWQQDFNETSDFKLPNATSIDGVEVKVWYAYGTMGDSFRLSLNGELIETWLASQNMDYNYYCDPPHTLPDTFVVTYHLTEFNDFFIPGDNWNELNLMNYNLIADCGGGPGSCGYETWVGKAEITINYTALFKNGTIPMTVSIPFYTIDQNPRYPENQTCLQGMNAGESCEQTWRVNATGNVGSNWDVFTVYSSSNPSVIEHQTSAVDVTILDLLPPDITNIECYDGIWRECSEVGFGDDFEKVRASCTSTSGGTVTDVKFKLTNIPDNNVLFYESFNGGAYEYDNPDMIINDSGEFALEVTCYDSNGFSNTEVKEWKIPWGQYILNILTSDLDNLTKNSHVDMELEIECLGGECGDTIAELVYWNNETNWSSPKSSTPGENGAYDWYEMPFTWYNQTEFLTEVGIVDEVMYDLPFDFKYYNYSEYTTNHGCVGPKGWMNLYMDYCQGVGGAWD